MKKIILAALLSVLMQGCVVPAAFVAGASVGDVIYDQRTTDTMIQDQNITYRAQVLLSNNNEIKSNCHINIVAFDHIVLLVGQAPTTALRASAEKIVKSVPNIKMLHNEITIEEPTSAKTRATDTWISAKVNTALLAEKGLRSKQIKVVVENGVVYLMGLTLPSQAKLAATTASQVEGVSKVVKLFEYAN